jgi:hypothetical protein
VQVGAEHEVRRSTRLAGLLLAWKDVETIDASDSDTDEPSGYAVVLYNVLQTGW